MHFRHPADEQLRNVDISFLATKKICSLSTLNYDKTKMSESINAFIKPVATRAIKPVSCCCLAIFHYRKKI